MTVDEARERAIAQLSEAFAHDLIGMDEFEARLGWAHDATTVSDVERLVSDLVDAPATNAPAALALAVAAPASENAVVAVLGGVERRGPWALPRRTRVRALLGGIVLDLREAILEPGVSEIHVTATLGGVQIIVPPGLSVDVSGTAILGGFARVDRGTSLPGPGRPLLRVRGRAILGGVAVETRGAPEPETVSRGLRDARVPALGPSR